MIDFVVSTIKGQGAFPTDMLRYDGAFPLTGADNERIAVADETNELFDDSYSNSKWTVRVTSSRPATAMRYASFGCSVVSETRYMKNGNVITETASDLLNNENAWREQAQRGVDAIEAEYSPHDMLWG
jgi:hypothetical protein